jgi:hypothetical protein
LVPRLAIDLKVPETPEKFSKSEGHVECHRQSNEAKKHGEVRQLLLPHVM